MRSVSGIEVDVNREDLLTILKNRAQHLSGYAHSVAAVLADSEYAND